MKGIAPLMRNTMLFYNYYGPEENKYITGVVALPFTPRIINSMTHS